MKFLNFLRFTPSKESLLDISLVLALLPHLFTLKWPMLAYLLFSLIFIVKKKNSKAVVITFALMGLGAIGLSFFAEYNFSNFSRLLVFISLLISLLVYAVVLQRLTRGINFYLLISPALLMILSFFFFNSISMLFYALFTLFCFTFLLLYARMKSSFKNVLRINSLLYLFSLPIVVVLFLTFPRISYKNASFGFKGEQIKRTGHDGTMYIDSNALLVPSPRVVMEVSFDKEVPMQRDLYFRGSSLYVDKGTQWVHGKVTQGVKAEAIDLGNIVNYRVKLYPHQKKWLYMLDIPISRPDQSVINQDFITLSNKPIDETYFYEGKSALSFKISQEEPFWLNEALLVDIERDRRTYEALLKAIDLKAEDSAKADQLLRFFASLELSYSLKPKPIDLEHPIDSFLFDSKIGYCVHFASAFANSARMIGLPSRIITGYKADRSNGINNYLIVKEADAHAWVEIYLKERGWTRFEPTATASQILTPQNRALSNSYTSATMQDSTLQKLFKKANIYYMYSRYIINTWILQYSRSKQMALLNELLTDTIFLLKFVASVFGFFLLSAGLFVLLQRKESEDPLLREMQSLMKILKREGFVRSQGETMYNFLQKVEESGKRYSLLHEISTIYHQERYGRKSENALIRLRAKILAFKRSLD